MAVGTQAPASGAGTDDVESKYAWQRLVIALLLSTIGGIGLWSPVVVLPAIQAEFGAARAGASLPYTATMVGFALGGIAAWAASPTLRHRRAADHRRGHAQSRLYRRGADERASGSSPGARPADRHARQLRHLRAAGRRRLALVQAQPRHRRGHLRQRQLPRRHDLAAGPAAFRLDRRLARDPYRRRHLLRRHHAAAGLALRRPDAGVARCERRDRRRRRAGRRGRGSRRSALQALLCSPASPAASPCRCRRSISSPIAAISATASRAAPQMLSLMLGIGVDQPARLGLDLRPHRRRRTLLLGSALQCLTLLFYLPFDGLTSLYIVSALFGLSQGGIVPSYAMIIREYFPPQRGRHAARRRPDGDRLRHGARRLDVGRDLSISPAPTARRSSTASCGTCSTRRSLSGCCASRDARPTPDGIRTAAPLLAAFIGEGAKRRAPFSTAIIVFWLHRRTNL